jgi:hypothetical protein
LNSNFISLAFLVYCKSTKNNNPLFIDSGLLWNKTAQTFAPYASFSLMAKTESEPKTSNTADTNIMADWVPPTSPKTVPPQAAAMI